MSTLLYTHTHMYMLTHIFSHNESRKTPTTFVSADPEANFSDIEPDKFQSMLTQVELKDPAQMAFAINILSKMTSTENVDPTTATPTEAASTSSSSGPTAGSPTGVEEDSWFTPDARSLLPVGLCLNSLPFAPSLVL